MSKELVVLGFIAGKIDGITNAPKASRNFYDLSKNDDGKNNFIYAIRPGTAQKVSGTVRSITYSQDFEVEFGCDFVLKNATDMAVRDAVEKIESFAESLSKEMHQTVSPIILIKPPTKNSPDVDHTKSSVSRTYTFEITYRVHL